MNNLPPKSLTLSPQIFAKGVLILRSCVRGLEVDDKTMSVWYELLKDLSDITYSEAVKKICRSTTNIYPGTNIVAMILEAADKVRMEGPPARLQLEDGYTDKQFENGRQKLKLIFDKLAQKIGV